MPMPPMPTKWMATSRLRNMRPQRSTRQRRPDSRARRSAATLLRVENEDVADLALRMERAAFVAAMPELILVGDEAFTKSPSLLITATMQVIDWKDPEAVRLAMLQDKPPARMVRPVRK